MPSRNSIWRALSTKYNCFFLFPTLIPDLSVCGCAFLLAGPFLTGRLSRSAFPSPLFGLFCLSGDSFHPLRRSVSPKTPSHHW
ncbi:hypothetical protein BDQ94DRAFT_133513 [Aspergillus welwitschiae]|uniref:Uncharacterized protein n=1 Tax=Aspergillus welwitschiae TaxID=1341132 RepID=A0A3F3QL05_9EURO|nr:hypothetical protein BDQ94DRAFT_133513 [Aspergillus welwitschiae]RDH39700.1 hypothetical protein BDQ94DRAFT_133513 [Aspergillus welwitschiae]